MIHLHPQQKTSYEAFGRLLDMRYNHYGNRISSGDLEKIYLLGCEHGFCKDEVDELLEDHLFLPGNTSTTATKHW